MSALGETLRALAAVLDSRGLRWFVFGAQAVSVRAAPRATQDVDVTVEVPPKELEGLVAALEQAGLDHRYPEIADRLLASGAVLPLIHTSGMEVDLVVAGSGLETLALGRADRLAVDGVEVPVAHPTDLVVMKVLSGRGKDQEDLRGLLASSDVDVVEARALLMQLEEAFMSLDPLDARAEFATQLPAAQVQQAVSWLRELRVEDFDWVLPRGRLRAAPSCRVHAPPWDAPRIEEGEAEFLLAQIS